MGGSAVGATADHRRDGRFVAGNSAHHQKQRRIAALVDQLAAEYDAASPVAKQLLRIAALQLDTAATSRSNALRGRARERMRASCWAVAAAVLCGASVAGAQTTSLDREVKATPGREVRVGIYTSMRPDCTAGPLPAIHLSVAPEHGAVTVRRATLKATNVKQCLAAELPALVAFYRPKRIPPTMIGLNWLRHWLQTGPAVSRPYFALRGRRPTDLAPDG